MRIDLLRKGIYELLAVALRRPRPEQLQRLTADEAVAHLSCALSMLPILRSAISRVHLDRFLAEVRSGGLPAMTRALSVEYCRLVLGPYSLPCPPYGSVYLDGGQVMGPSAVDALSRYRQEGLRVATGWAEPPDHIGVELEFMAQLSARYCAAADSRRYEEARHLLNAQREFLRDHLGRWGPIFADRLLHAASCHLYRFLGEFLPAWLAFDRDLLEAVAAALPKVRASCE